MTSAQSDGTDDIAAMYVALRDGYSPGWGGGDLEDGVLHAAWVNYSDVIYSGLAALQRVSSMCRDRAAAANARGNGDRTDTAAEAGEDAATRGESRSEKTAFDRYARIRDKPIESLTADEVAITVHYLWRGERYYEGLIKAWIDQDRQLERLARRGLELLGRDVGSTR
ncbi:MAG: hypothetical protein I3J03_05970 [Actinomyces succiniciruminis]|uniref:Uncharacterized protein n=1 Tax=Actinomyces succiniciruminis TaxID=1522002 RepID=A0A1L7RCA7_9ACTO|nr:hypothetical protein [Actinomyces succiniciruminis]MBM6979243.1 hypothetical protein [Actinomyces succiniciruminis]CED91565.1 Hypothetical protein AAM4_1733 [Actinomyces succiniciruminis]